MNAVSDECWVIVEWDAGMDNDDDDDYGVVVGTGGKAVMRE